MGITSNRKELEGKTIDVNIKGKVERVKLLSVTKYANELAIVDNETNEIVEVGWVAERTLLFARQLKIIPSGKHPEDRTYYCANCLGAYDTIWFWQSQDGKYVGQEYVEDEARPF